MITPLDQPVISGDLLTYMLTSAPVILTVVSGGLAIVALIKPSWPILPVSVFILAVAFFVFLYSGK